MDNIYSCDNCGTKVDQQRDEFFRCNSCYEKWYCYSCNKEFSKIFDDACPTCFKKEENEEYIEWLEEISGKIRKDYYMHLASQDVSDEEQAEKYLTLIKRMKYLWKI